MSVVNAADIPQHNGFLTDIAGVIKDKAKQKVIVHNIQKISTLPGSPEMAVLIVPSLNGETIEAFTNSVFTKWGIGKKDKNNGILLVISISDRKVRLEVGYGLEPIITDTHTVEIIKDKFVPVVANKKDNWELAINDTVNSVYDILHNELVIEPETGITLTNIFWSIFFIGIIFLGGVVFIIRQNSLEKKMRNDFNRIRSKSNYNVFDNQTNYTDRETSSRGTPSSFKTDSDFTTGVVVGMILDSVADAVSSSSNSSSSSNDFGGGDSGGGGSSSDF
jgi:uncharacterized protein